jgi:hypothetical protein
VREPRVVSADMLRTPGATGMAAAQTNPGLWVGAGRWRRRLSVCIEKKGRVALLWALLGQFICSVWAGSLASTVLRRRMRADGPDVVTALCPQAV